MIFESKLYYCTTIRFILIHPIISHTYLRANYIIVLPFESIHTDSSDHSSYIFMIFESKLYYCTTIRFILIHPIIAHTYLRANYIIALPFDYTDSSDHSSYIFESKLYYCTTIQLILIHLFIVHTYLRANYIIVIQLILIHGPQSYYVIHYFSF